VCDFLAPVEGPTVVLEVLCLPHPLNEIFLTCFVIFSFLQIRGDVRLFDLGIARELKPKDLIKAPDDYRCSGLTGSRVSRCCVRYSPLFLSKFN
jgi:hypothetical protein